MKRGFLIAFVALIFVSMGRPVEAPFPPLQDTRIRLKAMMIYQFATQIDWPKKYKTGSFVIGVFGNDDLHKELKTRHSSKAVGNQSMKILNFSSASEIERCHILFIDSKKSGLVTELAKKYRSMSTLIVSESPSGLEDGSIINFVVVNNQNRYALSKTNANKHNLVINSKIMGYAVDVK